MGGGIFKEAKGQKGAESLLFVEGSDGGVTQT